MTIRRSRNICPRRFRRFSCRTGRWVSGARRKSLRKRLQSWSGCACHARWYPGIRIDPVDRPCGYQLIAEANLGKSTERIGGSNRGTEQEIASVLGDLVDHPAPAANARAQRSAAIANGPNPPFAARHDAAPRSPESAVHARRSNPTLERSALRTVRPFASSGPRFIACAFRPLAEYWASQAQHSLGST